MADVQPFRALHYDLDAAGDLQALAAPPYDVIDDEQRAELVARSPHNVVEIDLPRADGDPYAHAAEVFAAWQRDGALVRDEQPALWALAQDYTGPDGVRRTRHGLFARGRSISTTLCGERATSSARCASSMTSYGGATRACRPPAASSA